MIQLVPKNKMLLQTEFMKISFQGRRFRLISVAMAIFAAFTTQLYADIGRDIGFSTLLFEKQGTRDDYVKIRLTASAGKNRAQGDVVDLGMLVEFSFRIGRNYYYYSYPAKLVNYNLNKDNQKIYSDRTEKLYLEKGSIIFESKGHIKHIVKLTVKDHARLDSGMRYGGRSHRKLEGAWKDFVEKWEK